MKKQTLINIALITLIVVIIIFVVLYNLNQKFSTEESPWLDGNGWTSLIVNIVSALSSLFLGLVAIWQNKKQREDNLRIQRINEIKETENNNKIQMQNELNTHFKYLEKYKDSISSINQLLLENDFLGEIHNIIIKISIRDADSLSNKEKENEYLLTKKTINKMIIFLNNVQNIVTYNKYYIDKLEDLLINLVELRENASYYVLTYFGDNVFLSNEKLSSLNRSDEFYTDSLGLEDKITLFYSCWTQYYQLSNEFFEAIESKCDLNTLNQLFNQNIDRSLKLREKVAQKTKELQRKYKQN